MLSKVSQTEQLDNFTASRAVNIEQRLKQNLWRWGQSLNVFNLQCEVNTGAAFPFHFKYNSLPLNTADFILRFFFLSHFTNAKTCDTVVLPVARSKFWTLPTPWTEQSCDLGSDSYEVYYWMCIMFCVILFWAVLGFYLFIYLLLILTHTYLHHNNLGSFGKVQHFLVGEFQASVNMQDCISIINPSIHFPPLIPLGVTGVLEPVSACSGEGRIILVASSSQGWHTETNNHPRSRSHLRST